MKISSFVRMLASAFLALGAGIPAFAAEDPAAQWRSPLLGRELVILETRANAAGNAAALPRNVKARLGQSFVQYETFTAARVPAADAAALRAGATKASLSHRLPIQLPFHSFDPVTFAGRTASWPAEGHAPEVVPGLYLVRFGFPIVPAWTKDLQTCGVETKLYLGNSTYLARADSLATIASCKFARLLDWAGPFLTTDRVSVETLREAADGAERQYELQFLPGTSTADAVKQLPAEMRVIETWYAAAGGAAEMRVAAGRAALDDLIDTSTDLLTIFPVGTAQLSDERQGQIIAGNVDALGVPTLTPPYNAWLTSRGLNSDANQQTVAVFDTGYDDGTTGPGSSHHPDLENPQRLVAALNITTDYGDGLADSRGHGTMVAGIIAGKGGAWSPPANTDARGFFRGEGIAPKAKLVAIKIWGSFTTDCGLDVTAVSAGTLPAAFNFARRKPDNSNLALISNHSWNFSFNTYDAMARLFDQRVIDAYVPVPPNPPDGVLDPMTVVVSAGNIYTPPNVDNKVLTPATAKNVITVGSTQSYRPSNPSAEGCNPIFQVCNPDLSCTAPLPSTEDATNIPAVSSFSARGRNFGPGTGSDVRTTRVKPDLVAPGGRVFSTAPYATPATYRCQGQCRKYEPAGSYYTFGEGTSFAAPVVSGAAALANKWFLGQGTYPHPSLVKAALIATADDLPNGGDRRPSNDQGWGRVNIGRLTDATFKFWINEVPANAVGTGQEFEFLIAISDASQPAFIVLVWSDPASAAPNTSQVPLVNDLNLSARSASTESYWYGNVFHENTTGIDDGWSQLFSGAPPPLDTINTVEAIFLEAKTLDDGEALWVRVKGASVPSGPQLWSVFGYNVEGLR